MGNRIHSLRDYYSTLIIILTICRDEGRVKSGTRGLTRLSPIQPRVLILLLGGVSVHLSLRRRAPVQFLNNSRYRQRKNEAGISSPSFLGNPKSSADAPNGYL